MQRTRVPEGVQDFLPEECRAKKIVEERLREEFIRSGFDEVETPSFEYYDVFAQGIGAYMQETMIKFFDLKGSILALRPDITVPIARMVSNNFAEQKHLRLCYIQNAFAVNDYHVGQRSEFTQAGVECIGPEGRGTDAEIIALAIRSMLKIGLKDFQVDIGQVAFFKGLTEGLNLPSKTMEELRTLIDTKNTVELEYRMEELDLSADMRKKLLALPSLFGGRDVIDRAKELCDRAACRDALKHLEQVYDMLCGFGYEKYLSIDLGMLHKLNYYSGVIFRGISADMGYPILSGGRYDGLNGEFGKPRPAIGFALGIKRAMIALERQNALAHKLPRQVWICSDAPSAAKGYALAEEMRLEGKSVVFEVDMSWKLLAEAQADGRVEQIYEVSGEEVRRLK